MVIRRFAATICWLILAIAAKSANGALVTEGHAAPGNPVFYDKLRSALALLERSDDLQIRRLHAAVVAAPGRISFRRMTDDPTTWSNDGDPDRGHTEPVDGRPKREGRSEPTDCIIYIPQSAVEPGSSRWKSGLLVHELVHALDFATGRYNRNWMLRERRAVFLQNVWRARVGFRLRDSYHGKFPTVDYQFAAQQGSIAEYLDYLYSRNDFPKPPAAAAR